MNTVTSITTEFIPHFFNDKKNIIMIGYNFWKNDIKRFLRDTKKQNFIRLFNFKCFKKNNYKNFVDYFQKEDSKKYDLIIADLPFELKKNTE